MGNGVGRRVRKNRHMVSIPSESVVLDLGAWQYSRILFEEARAFSADFSYAHTKPSSFQPFKILYFGNWLACRCDHARSLSLSLSEKCLGLTYDSYVHIGCYTIH